MDTPTGHRTASGPPRRSVLSLVAPLCLLGGLSLIACSEATDDAGAAGALAASGGQPNQAGQASAGAEADASGGAGDASGGNDVEGAGSVTASTSGGGTTDTGGAGSAEADGTEATGGDRGEAPSGTGGADESPNAPHISIDGRTLRVDGEPFHIRGVCYNPVPLGKTQEQGIDFAGAAPIDIPLMKGAGINTIRTYGSLTDRAVLDALYDAGIYVINSVYAWGGSPAEAALEPVRAVKDHPAILMWAIGNEWNYNGLYVGMGFDEARQRLNEVAALIRAEDPDHPIATVYGELPSSETLAAMPDIDLWGLNVYRGLGFGSLFDDFASRSDKPYFISEYGADAYNALIPGEDLESQAEATRVLTQSIADHGVALTPSGTCAGGTVFEWCDEWWKDGDGSPAEHDVGGIAPGGGPHPDQTFNEEWWGLVDIQRNPRPALQALQAVFDNL